MQRPFASSYLAREQAACAFIPDDFREPATRAAKVRAAASRRAHPELLTVLSEQQARLAPSAARDAHLEALRAGHTAVVATGQQVGLFLGPLYGFYKAASAIAVARALSAETGVRCAPLFWLQTEDHDFAEIASATVVDRTGAAQRLVLGGEVKGHDNDPRSSIAHRHLGPEVVQLLENLAEALPAGPHADEALALLRAHYREGRPIAAAFAGVLAELFADEGLLVFDPREERVAALAAPVYRRAIGGADALEAALTDRCAALTAAGFATQIEVRPGCALLFLHRGSQGGDVAGPRYRLQRQPRGAGGNPSAGWSLAGGNDEISDEALAATIDRTPLCLSTSALLRPIVQDTLWPTAAYVGGPGEINYFAQLAPVYEHFGLPLPLVVPRARFRCLDASTRRLLSQLGLCAHDVADLGRPRAELSEKLATLAAREGGTLPEPAAVRAEAARQIAAAEALALTLEHAAPSLARAAERTRGSIAHALNRLVARYTQDLASRDAVQLARLARLQAALAPGGVPQERAYAWPSLAGRIGPMQLKRLVMERLTGNPLPFPFATDLQDLEP